MTMRLAFVFLLVTFLFATAISAQEQRLKIGILAPQGTTWHKVLDEATKSIKKDTAGRVNITIFYGGSQGDESTVLRKIRSKQLQGGIFTGKTLGEINGDVRLMEVPFTFKHDRAKAYKVLLKMENFLNAGYAKNNFKNLGHFEIGQVYLMTTKKASSFEELKGIKIWTWQGDMLAGQMVQSMHFVSVPLALPDVLSALSTGIIEASYAPPMAAVAVQWHTKVKYLIDYPVTYSVGAFLVQDEAFKKLTPADQTIVETTMRKAIDNATQKTVVENEEALASMKQLGISFVKFSDKDIEDGTKVRSQVIAALTGKLFSADALNTFDKIVKEIK